MLAHRPSHLDFRLGFEPGLWLGLMLQLAELDLELALQGGIGTLGEAEPVADGGKVVDIGAADALYRR